MVAKDPIADSKNESEKRLSIGKFKISSKLEVEPADPLITIVIIFAVLVVLVLVGFILFLVNQTVQLRKK